MRRATSLLFLAFIGCGGEYEVRLRVVPAELLASASAVEVGIVASCEGELDEGMILGEPLIRFAPDESAPSLGSAETGPRGLYARLVDDSCQVIASGCSPVTLNAGGSDILRVVVRAAAGNACSSGDRCSAGACIAADTDAGMDSGLDAASDAAMDAEPSDAAMDVASDAPSLDTTAPFDAGLDGGPAIVDTTCWQREGACDWSAMDFTLEEAAPGLIATLPANTSNAAFSPDGCTLLFSTDGDLFSVTREGPNDPFRNPVELAELNTSVREDKAVFAPGELETFFTRDVGSDEVAFIHRATRSSVSMPFSDVQPVMPLNRDGLDSFDISLSGDGLRLYLSRPRSALSSQDILVASRPSLAADFTEPVLVEEVSDFDAPEAEPSVSADGRTLLFVRRSEGEDLRLHFVVRDDIESAWSAPQDLPGAYFSVAREEEGAISPDGCELLVSRDRLPHLFRYQP